MDVSFQEELLISAAIVAATTFVHAVLIAAAAAIFRTSKHGFWGPARFVRDSAVLTFLSLLLMAAHALEVSMWAAALIQIGVFETFEAALYFASVAFTTLGFGDIILPQDWRLLSGAIAANGLLLFGMSAAFMLETASRLRLGGDGR